MVRFCFFIVCLVAIIDGNVLGLLGWLLLLLDDGK